MNNGILFRGRDLRLAPRLRPRPWSDSMWVSNDFFSPHTTSICNHVIGAPAALPPIYMAVGTFRSRSKPGVAFVSLAFPRHALFLTVDNFLYSKDFLSSSRQGHVRLPAIYHVIWFYGPFELKVFCFLGFYWVITDFTRQNPFILFLELQVLF